MFLTECPWTPKGSVERVNGSSKITKEKYFTHLSLFDEDSGVHQWHFLTLLGSVEIFLNFRGPRCKKG